MLAVLGAEVFHRFVIEQAVDRARQRSPVEFVHPATQLVAPFGDLARHGDIGGDGERGRGDQLPAEVQVEDDADRDELDCGGSDVEQQEVEHDVDALGPAVDRLGDLSRATREMETERKLVQPDERVFGKLAGGVLPDAFEGDVAQIVEHHCGKASRGIGDDKGERRHHRLVRGRGHRIDRTLVGEG